MCGIPFLYFEGGLENPKKVALSIGYINIICVKWKRRKKSWNIYDLPNAFDYLSTTKKYNKKRENKIKKAQLAY